MEMDEDTFPNFDTTVGRIIFNEAIPQDIGIIDRSKENKLLYEVDYLVGKNN